MTRLIRETAGPPSGALAYVPLLVKLTNDADGDGAYSDSEAAPFAGVDVPLRLRLENAGSNELSILAIRDASPIRGEPAARTACRHLAGTMLAPGQSTTCQFVAADLAPSLGERAVAILEVDTSDGSTAGTVTDTTVITTGESGVLGLFVRRGLDRLATTGADIGMLLTAALCLSVAGALLISRGNRQAAAAGDPGATSRALQARERRGRRWRIRRPRWPTHPTWEDPFPARPVSTRTSR